MLSVILLVVILFLAFRAAPREQKEHALVHGAGQIGLLAAIALFGVDYFTSYFYATGELMSSLHPYGLQQYGYVAVAVIALANFAFGFLYIYSLGIFNEGGGAYTASMRYLWPTLSLVVAVTLIQDYVLTVVVSTLSGAGQLLSIFGGYNVEWYWHFLIGAGLATVTWFLTIRGRGESSRVVFILLAVFFMLTITMVISLFLAVANGAPAVPYTDPVLPVPSVGEALYHMLSASMKGMVALSGLEAMSNGIQFVIEEDPGFVRWGKRRLPRLKALWDFYSGRVGIGRVVQTSFLFYGGLTTLFLTYFSIHFNVFDGTLGRTLVGNLAFIGFRQLQGGDVLFWAYQGLAVVLLAAASITAFQDIQSAEWRNVAMGEIPERVVYRDPRGTFTRSVTLTYLLAVLISFAVRGESSVAVPFYGVGVFMPITVMGLAVRQHILQHYHGRGRTIGLIGSSLAAGLGAVVFIGQIAGKWTEGGWVVLISFSVLALAAHLVLLSPAGYREPRQIRRIVRDKSRIQGGMASIVEWQSLRMQEYRWMLLGALARVFEWFGVRRPLSLGPAPVEAGDYDEAVHTEAPGAPSPLDRYFETPREPKLGGPPTETAVTPKENE